MSPCGVLITAAGRSSRFAASGANTSRGVVADKLAARLGDDSVLGRSIAAFANVPGVVEIVVATAPDLDIRSPLGEEVARLRHRWHGHVRFLPVGGSSRAQTVYNGVQSLTERCEFVAVHDGARPLVSRDLIDCVLAAATTHGAAAPAVPVTSTIKQASATLPAPVERTVPRSTLWAMQTPQVARRTTLLSAFKGCPLPLDEVTDDVQLLELARESVLLVPGEERNLKITSAIDLTIARALLTAE